MLYTILRHIRNFFVTDGRDGYYKIQDNRIELDFVQENQYFLIEGSVFNDGVWQYGVSDLMDEEFEGRVCALAIPKAFIDLVSEIEDYQAKYGDALNSPYQSESFGGYSYTKGGGSGSSGSSGSGGWKSAFATRLNAWRKI